MQSSYSPLQLASACYVARIDLSAHGFYIIPEIDFDWTTGKGTPFRYFTYGAAFAEVEIDTLTGDFHTRVANIFLDLGYSLNPAIDVGQVLFSLIQIYKPFFITCQFFILRFLCSCIKYYYSLFNLIEFLFYSLVHNISLGLKINKIQLTSINL